MSIGTLASQVLARNTADLLVVTSVCSDYAPWLAEVPIGGDGASSRSARPSALKRKVRPAE